MKIGNWEITENGILCTKEESGNYVIPKDELNLLTNDEESPNYLWLVHLTAKSWITIDDIFALNSAFLIAAKEYNLEIDTSILIDTIFNQNQMMNVDLSQFDKYQKN